MLTSVHPKKEGRVKCQIQTDVLGAGEESPAQLLIYKQILKPIWTHSFGAAKKQLTVVQTSTFEMRICRRRI